MRTLVVGDIHGGFRALEQVLERCNHNPEEDRIIFLGDYVDGWSESAEVIDYLINLKGDNIFIRGNHDKWCEEWLITGNAQNLWRLQGGQATIDSYTRTGFLIEDSHRKFFRNLHNYYIDDENRGFVHGGFNSRKGLGHEKYQSDYYWDRDLWNLALLSHGRVHEGGTESSNRYKKHKEIFIGHTSTVSWGTDKPMNRCNVWNLDTGGGWHGKLTIMDIDTKEYWQSDIVKELYPNEHGR